MAAVLYRKDYNAMIVRKNFVFIVPFALSQKVKRDENVSLPEFLAAALDEKDKKINKNLMAIFRWRQPSMEPIKR